MSWSISASGTKDEVKAAVTAQAEAACTSYAGTPEAGDVEAARIRVFHLLDALVVGEGKKAVASLYGSHSRDASGMLSATFSVNVYTQAA